MPGFRSLLADAGGDLPRFDARVEALGRAPPGEREAVLRAAAAWNVPVSAVPAGGSCP